MKVKSYIARVQYTDSEGVHLANTRVDVLYETDEQIASAQAMVTYGVLAEAPAEMVEPTPPKGRKTK